MTDKDKPVGKKIATDNIGDRKKELKRELDDIHSELGDALNTVRSNVSERLNIMYWIKKYPTSTLAAALVLGLSAGIKGGKMNGDGFSTTLVEELKKVATRHAVRVIVKQIENKIDDETNK